MTYEVKFDVLKINEFQQEFVLKTFDKKEDALMYLFDNYSSSKKCRFGISKRFVYNGLEFETETENIFLMKKINIKSLDSEVKCEERNDLDLHSFLYKA